MLDNIKVQKYLKNSGNTVFSFTETYIICPGKIMLKGGKELRKMSIWVESLAIIEVMDAKTGSIAFRTQPYQL